MNYRLIVRYFNTGVVTDQKFPDLEDINTITDYLDNVIENGAKLGYEVQRKYDDGMITILDWEGESLEGWSNLRWE